MKQFKSILTQLLLVTTLMLPWATAEALETFKKSGVISKLGYDVFTISGKKYRITAGAKLKSSDLSRQKFKDFKEGDEILVGGKVLDGVNYVDIIIYFTPDPS